MKRKILFVLFILFSTNIFATGLRFINYSKIKNLKSYEDEFMFAKNNELLCRSWIHDDYWKANISKEECRNNLNKLYKSICSKAEPKNIEYLLLKGIISEYLYNLDEPGFFDVVEKNYLAIKKIKNADWRHKWFLGFFYHNAAAPVKAINELNDVLEKIPEEHLQFVPAFFYDYACVAYVCQMPATALKYLEKFEQYANVDISDDPCFKAAKNILKPFDKSQINRDSLVMKQHKGNLGVFCRPFGFFMNSKSDWIPTKAVISNTQTDFLATFKSQYISTKNGSTSYSVLFWAVLNEENSDTQIFDSFSDDFSSLRKIFPPSDRVQKPKSGHATCIIWYAKTVLHGRCGYRQYELLYNLQGENRAGSLWYQPFGILRYLLRLIAGRHILLPH